MNSFLTASSAGGVVTVTSTGTQYWPISVNVTDTNPNFSSASFSASPSGMSDTTNTVTVYSYAVGYDATNNVNSVNDSVIGNWNFNVASSVGNYSYDTLNRLVSGQATSGPYSGKYGCWTYDGFGNRTMEAISSTPCNSNPAPTTWAHYNSSNQITGTPLMTSGDDYDAAGDVTNDGSNQYLYDGAGRICAVKNSAGVMTQYIYDGEGNRVAKGRINLFSCASGNGFSLTTQYVVGIGGEQLSELNASNQWQHSNVFAAGALLGTYAASDTYFDMTDWQGTRRAEGSVGGCLTGWLSLPYGDNTSGGNPLADPSAVAIGSTPLCSVDATEHHYTGKLHDSESGNDDFGARYYTDVAGRWLSPDWAAAAEAVPYAIYGSPQTLNLYAFVGNNPLSNTDPDGHQNGQRVQCGGQGQGSGSTSGSCGAGGSPGADHPAQATHQIKGRASHSLKSATQSFLAKHHTAVRVAIGTAVAATAISGLFDGGASEAAIPEELEIGGELETAADAAESAEGATDAGETVSGTNEGGQLTSRSSLRKSTVQDAWDNATDGPTGGKACPTCGKEVKVSPGSGPRDWDVDHQPKWTDRQFSPNASRQDVINNYQEGTSLRCPSCNRSDN